MSIDRANLPPLNFEDSGVAIRGRSFWGESLAPSTAGDGWSLYILYRDHLVKRGPWSVHEVNLQTEKVTAHYGATEEPQQISPCRTGVSTCLRRLLCIG